jgi:eukaryotic-like serine/threonine-protein kinase
MSHASISTGDSLIGSTLAGRYRVEARVGSGAMGAVYRAEHAVLGRRVALKILNRDRLVGGDTVQRFRREAQALSALHHPNTVRVFDFGASDEGMLYLAMELLEGEALTDRIVREGPLPVQEALDIIQQVLRSIGEAHGQGLVHRDLKPDNVFLARVQHAPVPIVKVLDFGIAKAIEGERAIDQFETLDGTVFGTPRYMSPEQAAGKPLDLRSDLYSVGIMLYELLSGHPPFVDNDAVVVMARHIREQPVPVCRAAPTRPIPPSLEACLSKALAKKPADRFQTAEEFERALQGCRQAAARLERLAQRGLHHSFVARVWLAPSWTRWSAAGAAALLLLAATRLVFFTGDDAGTTSDMLAARDPHDRHPDPHELAPPALSADEAARTPASSDEAAPQLANVHAATVDSAREPLASAAHGARRVVVLKSHPAAAEVFQDGAQLGVTPLDVSMSPGASLTVQLRKRGFADHTLELHAGDRARVVALKPLKDKSERAEKLTSAASKHRERSADHAAGNLGAPPLTAVASPAAVSVSQGSPYEKF